MTDYIVIAIGVILVRNFVLAQFLGLCPFIGVSKRTDSAIGMGLAVTFVMTMASAITWAVYNYILLPGDSNILAMIIPGNAGAQIAKNGMVEILEVGSFILVIASFVQLVEMAMRKFTPALYEALGIYLPLITTNCAVMGVALLNTEYAVTRLSFLQATVQGFCAGVGFMLAMLLMSGIRERLDLSDVPKPLKGVPIAFICAGCMALAFLGFSGLV